MRTMLLDPALKPESPLPYRGLEPYRDFSDLPRTRARPDAVQAVGTAQKQNRRLHQSGHGTRWWRRPYTNRRRVGDETSF